MSDTHEANHASLFEEVYKKKFVFTAIFTLIFFISTSVLYIFGFAPDMPFLKSRAVPGGVSTGTVKTETQGEMPSRIEIPSIGVQALVSNPESKDISSLDQALMAGAVRYPDTARLGEEGNVLLFGHSSHLPVVHNKAYKAFNDIQKLKAGEPIFVIGDKKVYTYAVENVASASVDTGEIPLSLTGAKLTLVTCDNFGTKADRFIVTAHLVNIETLQN